MLFLAACAQEEAPLPNMCENAYEFTYAAEDDFPLMCYKNSNEECCIWDMNSESHLKMCLNAFCLWEID